MTNLEYFYIKTLNFDLFNKFNYKNIKELPKIKKIILNFGCKTTELKLITANLLALELITNQKSKLTETKFPNLTLKIKKGNPAGCKVTLRKNRMISFFIKTVFNIFPRLKNFSGFKNSEKTKKNIFSYTLNETFSFNEFEKQYYLFHKLSNLNINIITSCKTKKELLFLLRSLQFPIMLKNTNKRS